MVRSSIPASTLRPASRRRPNVSPVRPRNRAVSPRHQPSSRPPCRPRNARTSRRSKPSSRPRRPSTRRARPRATTRPVRTTGAVARASAGRLSSNKRPRERNVSASSASFALVVPSAQRSIPRRATSRPTSPSALPARRIPLSLSRPACSSYESAVARLERRVRPCCPLRRTLSRRSPCTFVRCDRPHLVRATDATLLRSAGTVSVADDPAVLGVGKRTYLPTSWSRLALLWARTSLSRISLLAARLPLDRLALAVYRVSLQSALDLSLHSALDCRSVSGKPPTPRGPLFFDRP